MRIMIPPLAAARLSKCTSHQIIRPISCLSPRTVLNHSSQSYVASLLALAAVFLYAAPDMRTTCAHELDTLITSLHWTNDLRTHRAWLYQAAQYSELAVHAPPFESHNGTHVHLSMFGRSSSFLLGDLDLAFTKIRTALIDPILAQLPPITHLVNQQLTNLIGDQHNDLGLPRPDLGTRTVAWIIDSMCIGLVACPVWRTPFFGGVVSVLWVCKDYLFTLLPGMNASPGYQVLGLNKVHVPTALRMPNRVLESELPGMLGHNTLRLLTWCSSAGVISNLASAVCAVYAVGNGLAPTLAAWDRLAGVQVVYRSDLVHLENKVPLKPRLPAFWSLVVNNNSIQGTCVDKANNFTWKFSFLITQGGGEHQPRAKLVFVYSRQSVLSSEHDNSFVPVNRSIYKEFDLPSWIVVN